MVCYLRVSGSKALHLWADGSSDGEIVINYLKLQHIIHFKLTLAWANHSLSLCPETSLIGPYTDQLDDPHQHWNIFIMLIKCKQHFSVGAGEGGAHFNPHALISVASVWNTVYKILTSSSCLINESISIWISALLLLIDPSKYCTLHLQDMEICW